mgnify:CR=1 FL=1
MSKLEQLNQWLSVNTGLLALICCLLLLISQQPMLTRPAMHILNLFKVILENLPVDFHAKMMYTRFAGSAFARAHAVIKETRGTD